MYASGERPLQTALSIKTRMGGDSRLEVPSMSKTDYTELFNMEECSSFFIRTIVESLKKQFPQIPNITDECVVTVPAAFNDDERVATQNAVLLGGFKNCIILDEPTAALLSYINSDVMDQEEEENENNITYKLVYDIGGGTLDVSIAKLTSDGYGGYEVDIVGLSERMNLGGDNFDRLLGAYFLKEFESTNTPIEGRSKEDQGRIIARIVSNAERYKINMNDKVLKCGNNQRRLAKEHVKATFELIDNMYVDDIIIKKETLDDLFSVYTSPNATKFGLLAPIKTALRRSKLQKEDISEVVLTGGMSNFYAVYDTLSNYFGDIPLRKVEDTRTAVSRGAALYHWSLDKENDAEDTRKLSTISNRMASNIYVRNATGDFELLIPSDLSRTKGTFYYTIQDDDVAYFPFFLYNGTEPEQEEDNTDTYTQLAGRMIHSSPDLKKGDKIPIEWSIDDNKVITVQLQGNKNIQLSRLLTKEEISQSIVQNYSVNSSRS